MSTSANGLFLNFNKDKIMEKKKLNLILISILVSITGVFAQVKVSNQQTSANDFPLMAKGVTTGIHIDPADYEVVKIASGLLAEDIQRVTGMKHKVAISAKIRSKVAVVIGTLGKNQFIDQLIRDKKLNVSSIENGWEQYIIQTIDKPTPEIDKALIIAGCDRRGTAFGVFSISEAIGISPLYWWADVPVKKQSALYLQPISYVSKAPSVKYRGIFINDEGWGFRPWAAETWEPEVGNAGPKTYSKVCELILRMKGNMLAPAMHPKTVAFNLIPENKVVADKYAIIVTSSHCEPLLYNNTTEWDSKINGEWNYLKNKEGINSVLDKRVSEVAPYENAYVLAMRGIHDAGMVGVSDEQKVSVTEQAMQDQRDILRKHIGKPIEEIPQIFVPYKEVLDVYEKGLKLPEEVIIVWPDDNYGYIKRLSDANEQKRKGGSGVYYHISYLGEPHDYLWLNTTPPALMYEEMKKAYNTGADRYWLLNVGDIKPGELGMKFFLDMAWDIDRFNFDNAYTFDADYLASIFGEEYKEELQNIIETYYILGFQRKPEAMGWGFEWNHSNGRAQLLNTDFSFINYNEAENRMMEYDRISNKAEKILKGLPEAYQSAFYELLFYPVKGAALMNKKMLTAQQNRWYARQGRAATNRYADLARSYHDSIQIYTKHYNTMLNGKWNKMMSLAPGWTATYQNMPPTDSIKVASGADMRIFTPGKDMDYGVNNLHVLPCLTTYIRKSTFIELYNKGDKAFRWQASTSNNWIRLSRTSGETLLQDRITVEVDWEKAPVGTNITGEICITSDGKTEKVYLPLFNPQSPGIEELKGLYVEENGYVSINPAHFHRKQENNDIQIRTIKGLGYEGECLQLGEATKPSQVSGNISRVPKVECDFHTFSAGTATVYVYALPLFPLNSNYNTRYGVMIDNGMVHWLTTAEKEYSSQWTINVARNSSINVFNMNIDKPGKHTLKLLCGDPGMVIQKIVIDFGGMKRSYLGPEPTLVDIF